MKDDGIWMNFKNTKLWLHSYTESKGIKNMIGRTPTKFSTVICSKGKTMRLKKEKSYLHGFTDPMSDIYT